MRTLIAAHPNTPILITGHSLGGALAVLSALDIKKELMFNETISLYTFGAPRVGNDEFSDHVFA